MIVLTTLIQCSTEILARASRQEKEIKLIRIEKEEIKWSLLAYDTILYVDINTLSKKNCYPNKLNKVAEYKIRIENLVVFLY